MPIFLLWFGILFVIYKVGAPWWVWLIFVLGSFFTVFL